MGKAKAMCCLPDVITAGMAMRYFDMAGSEFDYIIKTKGLPAFRTEYNRYYFTDSIVCAINEFIAESAEINSLLPV